MDTLTSADGTPIAYDRAGTGRRSSSCPAPSTTTPRAPPRGGAGGRPYGGHLRPAGPRSSGDTAPYAIDREVEDLAALIDVAGGAPRCSGTPRAASWPSRRPRTACRSPTSRSTRRRSPWAGCRRPADLPEQLADLSPTGRRATRSRCSRPRASACRPRWSSRSALADVAGAGGDRAEHCLRRDDHLRARRADPRDGGGRRADAGVTGAQTWPGLPESAAALAALLPNARHVVVPGGADHGIPAEPTAAVVRELLA